MGKIRIVAIRIGEDPNIEEMESGLQPMKDLVGGWIERVGLTDEIDLWCNEEGLYTCQPNRMVRAPFGRRVQINGDMFIAKHDAEGETIGLTMGEAMLWRRLASEWPESLHSIAVRTGTASN